MKAFEYYAEILPDGHLSVPEKIKDILTGESKTGLSAISTILRPNLLKSKLK